MADESGKLNPEDLDLNTLRRLTKSSPRLVLEKHSSCEVPAGCGGVVLRWVEPNAPIRLALWRYVRGGEPVDAWLDGVKMESSRGAGAAPGPHVLVIEVKLDERVNDDGGRVLIAVTGDGVPRSGQNLPELRLGSRGDGSWMVSTREPAPEDHEIGASLDGWAPAPGAVVPEVDPDSWQTWSWESCVERGAEGLALPDQPGHYWLRVQFEVSAHPASEQP